MNNNPSQNNGFMSGFILGILVGVVGLYLLGTKKGKKLLKVLSEEGIEGMAELQELLTDHILQEDTTPLKKKEVKPVKKIVTEEVIVKEEKKEALSTPVQESIDYLPRALGRIQSSGRRFFKGIPKKNN